jgi:hypothetical protein
MLPNPNNNNVTLFSIYINGVFQPRASGNNFYTIGGSGCSTGMRLISYNWLTPTVGSNNIQIVFSNTTANVFSDTKSVIIAPPLQISGLNGNNELIWDSAPNVDYEVLATTNLAEPFENISGVIPSQGTTTFYYDTSYTNAIPQKFYEVEIISSQ